MPPRSTRYTLVGFSAELDWRPLVFKEPLQTFRVCSACGLVRKRTAMLPCMHTFCEACYEQSAQEGARTCPRDGRRCEEQDVDWKDFQLEELLETEVGNARSNAGGS
ncbi:hypothetical protein V5799_000244 [Amblyomma americanum]|uniref:RING-type domain-containing protein n=1 Tax=Amblyomma americanum TaxID=6943 RepID=A0AAQ4D3L5_AMBAM